MIWNALTQIRTLFVLGLLLAQSIPASAAEDDIAFTGAYSDEQIVVTLGPPSVSGGQTSYTGAIQLGDQKFPCKAQQEGGRLTGTFENEGDAFHFTANLVGRILLFATDGTTYRLKKQTTNPLARAPTKPNPLAALRTNTPAPAATAPAMVGAGSSALRLQRFSIIDHPAMIGGEAFSLLVPADWQVEGAVNWRMHQVVPAYVTLRASNSNRTEVLEAFPSIPSVWVEGGIPLFPAGSNHMGNEVGQPIEDPIAYIQQVTLPRFRKNLNGPQLVTTEELPKVAEVIADAAQDPQKKFRAARMRLEYPENGRVMQEDIYCVMALASVPAIRATFWGADRNYSFKAEKGRLDVRTKLFQTMVCSFRSNQQWSNRYMQLLQLLGQSPFDSTRPPAELARFVPGVTDEINDVRRQLYERQQANQERVNASFSEYIRGLEEYRNPFESRTIRLPAGYMAVWVSPLGEYLLTDDSNFNPNSGVRRDWQRMEKDR